MSFARARRRVLLALTIAATLLVLAALWVGVRSVIARGELEAARPSAASAQKALLAGDAVGARISIDQLVQRASTAAALTSDPIFRLAEWIPFAGPNFTAFREAAAAVDALADGLSPLRAVAGTLSFKTLAPVGGTVDLAPLQKAAPTLAAAESALADASRDIRSIDTSTTIEQVTSAVNRLVAVTDDAAVSIAAISRTAVLLPKMLGAEGDRNYLLIFQNNAEVRASGGLPGALAIISTSGGHFEMTTQTSARTFPFFDEPVLPLDYATESLYGSNVARRMQNVTLTPDFPTSASFAAEMWRRQYGVAVDGVIAVDPVVLSYILKATGPVELASGDTVSVKNAVRFLLSDVYEKYPDNAKQDEVFADAARSIFTALSSGSIDAPELLTQLTRGVSERRVLLWNSRPEEQALVADSDFAGELPETNLGATVVGVFLNDATGAKLGYYLDATSRLSVESCAVEAGEIYRTTIQLTSAVPVDALTSLAPAVIGPGTFGVAPAVIRTRVSVYGPVGSAVAAVTVDGAPARSQPEFHLNRPVAQVIVDLDPGQSQTVVVDMRGADSASPHALLRMTPMLKSGDAVSQVTSCRSSREG